MRLEDSLFEEFINKYSPYKYHKTYLKGDSMGRIDILEIYKNADKYADKKISVSGWIRTSRFSNKFGFAEVNDGSCFKNLQIVCEQDITEGFADIAALNVGAAASFFGVLVLTPGAKQPFELKADSFVLEGASDPEYPLQKKRHTQQMNLRMP